LKGQVLQSFSALRLTVHSICHMFFFSGTIFENSDCWLGPFHKPETLAASIGNHHAATMKQDARSDTKLCYW